MCDEQKRIQCEEWKRNMYVYVSMKDNNIEAPPITNYNYIKNNILENNRTY